MSFQGNQYGGYQAYPNRPPMNPPVYGPPPVVHGPPVVVVDSHHHHGVSAGKIDWRHFKDGNSQIDSNSNYVPNKM
ncbi:hypothetical protein GCK32_007823 [Trichostrongylus colubriformis]|uniref:Uncharacterized protein n=1 Tax=Trichostrongylus colubriformis TaxID=6319 RepID=A0AAN8F7G5_TRICO